MQRRRHNRPPSRRVADPTLSITVPHVARILHLIDDHLGAAPARALGDLTRSAAPGDTQVVRSIGPGGAWAKTLSSWRSIRRDLRDFDLVHTWSPRALAVATFTGLPIVHAVSADPTPAEVRWLSSAQTRRGIEAVCSTATSQRLLLSRGIHPDHCHLIRPGVDFSRIKTRRGIELRRELGFADGDVVLLTVGESTDPANHALALWTVGILNVMDDRHKLLMWGRGPLGDALDRMAATMEQPGVTRRAEKTLGRAIEFDELFPAADAIVVTANAPVPTLFLAQAMAAGLPIVSTVSPAIAELIEDRHTALLVRQPTPRALAQRILEIREDHSLQWSITDRARTEAFEFFALGRFLRQWRAVHHQVADGHAIEIPEESPGAGSRFHGLAR